MPRSTVEHTMDPQVEATDSIDLTKHAPVVFVDPFKIVNEFGTRPVLSRHREVIKSAIKAYGFNSSHIISCRVATFPEVMQFYKLEPYNYSDEKTETVARTAMRQENAGGHMYAYDGHIRKFACRDLVNQKFLFPGFRLRSFLLHRLTKDEEIAYSLACNASTEHCVPLSVLALLLLCHDYDKALNDARHENQKLLSAAEVSRRMVALCSSHVAAESAKRTMSETRRQYLSVSRRLPASTIDFFRQLMHADHKGLQAAYTIANLKSISLRLSDEESLCLVKRMIKHYETSLPSPKPIHPKQITGEVVNLRRALKQIVKFVRSCDYETLPNELNTIADSMKTTQLLDKHLTENANLDSLFPPLVEACKNLVSGGTNRIALACANKANISPDSEEPGHSDHETRRDSGSGSTEPDADKVNTRSGSGGLERKSANNSPQESKAMEKATSSHAKDAAGPNLFDDQVDSVDPDEAKADTVEELAATWLPNGWSIANCSYSDFASGNKSWAQVEGNADLVVMELPAEQLSQEWLNEIVQHAGIAMRETGVAHIFCSFVQFGMIYNTTGTNRMMMMPFPMIYVQDSSKVKKRTLSQHPQLNCECAAVFWRTSETARTKHFFSTKNKYPLSTTDAWTNTVTNVLPSKEKLAADDGTALEVKVRTDDVAAQILGQWRKPTGLCYNPFAGSMGLGMACFDRGIQYVAVEEREKCFTAAGERLIARLRERQLKRSKTSIPDSPVSLTRNESANSVDESVCGIGQRLCKKYGPSMTFKCRCGKPMHDLCDWPSVMKVVNSADREGISCCSKDCFETET